MEDGNAALEWDQVEVVGRRSCIEEEARDMDIHTELLKKIGLNKMPRFCRRRKRERKERMEKKVKRQSRHRRTVIAFLF